MTNTFQFETPRTILRSLTIEDAENFYQLNLDPEVLKFTGDIPFKCVEEAHEFLTTYLSAKKNGLGRFAVINKISHKFMGWCGLGYSANKNEFDIGYRFFKEYWNQGYATETALACLDFGFKQENLNEIVGRARSENYGSIKVLQKIGMHLSENRFEHEHELVIYKIEKNIFERNQEIGLNENVLYEFENS
ncbi:MAG: GNAT family N-acetyltransferase [Bacteroidia bacterium]|nr:GNAT family N-acetyltransferase [Bacteroidia bacterium]MCF8426538.1 GNAT family N-acetyltransferase [Bacteroidia bacterium]